MQALSVSVVIKISLKGHEPMNPINCYLCDATSFITRKGQVRDAPNLKILQPLAFFLDRDGRQAL